MIYLVRVGEYHKIGYTGRKKRLIETLIAKGSM